MMNLQFQVTPDDVTRAEAELDKEEWPACPFELAARREFPWAADIDVGGGCTRPCVTIKSMSGTIKAFAMDYSATLIKSFWDEGKSKSMKSLLPHTVDLEL